MDATTHSNLPIEIAYYVPGVGWKRKTFKTEAARDRFIDRLLEKEGSDVEIRYAA